MHLRSHSSIPEIASALEKKILSSEIRTRPQLEVEKALLARRFALPQLPKNADIIPHLSSAEAVRFMQMKPVRTLSGIANIAVMWLPEWQLNGNKMSPDEMSPSMTFTRRLSDIDQSHSADEEGKAARREVSCPASCIYCAQGPSSPKSYTGTEPATLRAQRFSYDPVRQIQNRLYQFRIMGHPVDKCELIIMGGTFMAWGGREQFVKSCYDAFNGFSQAGEILPVPSATLEEAKSANESAHCRVVGLTIETRADFCPVDELLSYGCTRVEIGVQSTDDEVLKAINRGHSAQQNVDAIAHLKQAGLKLTAHWMPGLTGLFGKIDIEREIDSFRQLFTEDYQPDELKIYPVLVIPGTPLYDKWKAGEYDAMTEPVFLSLMKRFSEIIPEHVRVKRVMRDISSRVPVAGVSRTNMRQSLGDFPRCIRSREIRSSSFSAPSLVVRKYRASGGEEFFLSYEESGRLLGFCRLRLGDKKNAVHKQLGQFVRPSELSSSVARIRELHVYGSLVPVGSSPSLEATQHRGFGKSLLFKAENIAKNNGYNEIAVTSGVGVREYFRKLGYQPGGWYMSKKL